MSVCVCVCVVAVVNGQKHHTSVSSARVSASMGLDSRNAIVCYTFLEAVDSEKRVSD